MTMDKGELLLAFLNDGEAGLELLMAEYEPSLLRYCHNILCDYHEAQDAIQLTFIKAYNHRTSFRRDMGLSPWLYRIAYTTCIDLMRKRKIRLLFSLPQAESQYIPPEIREALLTLCSDDRALVFGRIMENRSFEELEKIHGKSAATLRKRYERARKKLLTVLKADYPYYAKLEESAR